MKWIIANNKKRIGEQSQLIHFLTYYPYSSRQADHSSDSMTETLETGVPFA